MVPLYLAELETPRGVFSLLFHRTGICELFFPGFRPAEAEKYPRRPPPWPAFAEDLHRYFHGEKVDWRKYPLDMSSYPPFTRRVLEAVRQISYGTVRSYREVAEAAGSPRAWRAAGQAVKVNRHPLLVPCHRVIRSDGQAGGFSGPPGWKQMLLELEGIRK